MKNEQMLTLITKVKREVKRLENTSIGNLMDAVAELEIKAQNGINEDIAIKQRLTSLETRLENYENHTHSYGDETISDTEDGSGTISTLSKNTNGVN